MLLWRRGSMSWRRRFFELGINTKLQNLQCPSARSLSKLASQASETSAVFPARTRFAPSPTGSMHLGSLRTALFNYLLAKATGGQFLLRIEDTDRARTVPGAEEQIEETLNWAGLTIDEGPSVGGSYGPYRQSERAELHREHAEILVKSGHAYRCFCTAERLRDLAFRRGQTGGNQDYDRTCTFIPADESEQRAAAGERFVIRLMSPEKLPEVHDEIYGKVQFGKVKFQHGEPSFEDPVIMKSDGLPTYHLANVVDDHFMNITHVIRGNEWLVSTPKHVYLYNAFNWKPPKFAHVGLLQNQDGSKLSKRDGATHVASYREMGYTSDGLLNFLVLMGWHNPGRSDVLHLQDMIQKFTLKALSKGDTKVSFQKLTFLQRSQNLKLSDKDLSERCEFAKQLLPFVRRDIKSIISDPLPNIESEDYITLIIASDLKNFVNSSQFVMDHDYMFNNKIFPFDQKIKDQLLDKDHDVSEIRRAELYSNAVQLFRDYDAPWDALGVEDRIRKFEEKPEKAFIYKVLRYAVAGGKSGGTLYSVFALLGRDVVMKRLEKIDIFDTIADRSVRQGASTHPL